MTQRQHDYGAEANLRDAVRAEPARAEGYHRLAAWLSRAGRFSQACEVLRDGLARAAPTAPLHHLLGLILAGAGDLDRAQRHLAKAAEQRPGRFEYVRDLGLAQGAAGKTAESLAALRQASALAGGRAAVLEALLRVGEQALAAQGRRAARRPPASAPRLAMVEHLVLRQPELAEAFLLSDGAPSEEARGTLQAVRRALAHLVGEHPTYADLHFGISRVSEGLGETDRAIEAAEKALAINPRYAEAALLAVRLYEKTGRADRAAECCRRVTDLRPDWIDAHLSLGRLLRRQGRHEEAGEAYRQAILRNAACLEARRGLAEVTASLGPAGGDR
jgi:tetratricopeptide (TPR) repeat protein